MEDKWLVVCFGFKKQNFWIQETSFFLNDILKKISLGMYLHLYL